jgi:hypothetical protein
MPASSEIPKIETEKARTTGPFREREEKKEGYV